MTTEHNRVGDARQERAASEKSAPYLSERQRETVHEDYGITGGACSHFAHDKVCSRAYRWGHTSAGLGASRQACRTGIIGRLIHLFAAEDAFEHGCEHFTAQISQTETADRTGDRSSATTERRD